MPRFHSNTDKWVLRTRALLPMMLTLCVVLQEVPAQETAVEPVTARSSLELDAWDIAYAGAGLAFAAGTILILPVNALDQAALDGMSANLSEIEDWHGLEYKDDISAVGSITSCLAAFTPAAVLLASRGDKWLEIAAVHAEALAWTYGAKNLVKYLVPRVRPYVWNQGLPGDPDMLAEAYESFLSGHTALAFCGAAVASTLCAQLYPDDPASPWIIGGSIALAAGTAALRVASGEHYPTDVLAGAVLGSLIGFAMTELHIHRPAPIQAGHQSLSLQITPASLILSIK